MEKIKAGLFGLGHLGKTHLKLLKEICSERNDVELIGLFDSDKEKNEVISKENGFEINNSAEELISKINAAVIVTPTSSHFELAGKCIAGNINTFIEKPVTETTEQAEKLVALSKGKKSRFRSDILKDLIRLYLRLIVIKLLRCLLRHTGLRSLIQGGLMFP